MMKRSVGSTCNTNKDRGGEKESEKEYKSTKCIGELSIRDGDIALSIFINAYNHCVIRLYRITNSFRRQTRTQII